MSDTTYELFQHYGTDAERLAFTPSPAAGIQPIYVWYATDTGLTWLYDTSWHSLAGPGGSIPSLVQGDMLYASAANTLAALNKNTTATRYLSNTGGSNNPAWAQVALTTGVSGVLPVANGGTGSSSGASILAVQVSIPDANVKALPTTRFELIAAQGANTLIWPLQITLMFKAGGTVYTNINTTSAFLTTVYGGSVYGSSYLGNDSTLSPTLTDLTAFLGTAGGLAPMLWPFDDDRGSTNGWGNMPYPEVLANLVNQPLQLLGNNGGSGDFTGGAGGNVVLADIVYRVITTP